MNRKHFSILNNLLMLLKGRCALINTASPLTCYQDSFWCHSPIVFPTTTKADPFRKLCRNGAASLADRFSTITIISLEKSRQITWCSQHLPWYPTGLSCEGSSQTNGEKSPYFQRSQWTRLCYSCLQRPLVPPRASKFKPVFFTSQHNPV